jgi:transcriptional regulator with XRE-family HTH domain
MSDWRERLQRRQAELGYTRAELARRADIKPTMLHDIIERGTTPSVANLFKIARALNFTLSELYEGTVRSTSNTFALTGVLEGGTVLDASRAGEKADFTVSFPREDLESIRVKSDLLDAAGYRRGDVLMGVRHAADRASNLLGRDCIVCLASGERMVGVLHKQTGRSSYNLRFFHRSQPDREAVEIAWAAPITMIVRD